MNQTTIYLSYPTKIEKTAFIAAEGLAPKLASSDNMLTAAEIMRPVAATPDLAERAGGVEETVCAVCGLLPCPPRRYEPRPPKIDDEHAVPGRSSADARFGRRKRSPALEGSPSGRCNTAVAGNEGAPGRDEDVAPASHGRGCWPDGRCDHGAVAPTGAADMTRPKAAHRAKPGQ
jgi:hypothetical protein